MDMRWKFQSESLGEHTSLGAETNTVTSVELLKFIAREYPDRFVCGLSYSAYRLPPEKIDAEIRRVVEVAG